MEKYIIAVDMDGTLLNSENKISERNRNVLQRLIDDGHYVVPATGRTRELIPQEFSVLRGVKWGIVENGCVVWDYDKNEMIWQKTMPKGMVSKILKDVEDSGAKGWIAEAYANGIAYSDADARDYVASVADKDLLEKTFVDYFLSRHKYVKDFYHQEDILDQAEKINIYFDDMETSRALREKWKDLGSSKPGRRFLISESVRGEGAVLYNKDGERFVNELLPRDVVTKAIREQMEKDGTDHVWLSMENIDKNTILEHFPNICERCLEEGYDVTKEWIPVVPAQHYFMGGIWVDSDSRTSMEHLYAVGETSCNGVHGANRLASNSLLESLVFAKRAAHKISGVKNAVNPVLFCKEAI